MRGVFERTPVAASPHVARLSARRAGGQQQQQQQKAPASASTTKLLRRQPRPPSVSISRRPLTLTPSPLALPPRSPVARSSPWATPKPPSASTSSLDLQDPGRGAVLARDRARVARDAAGHARRGDIALAAVRGAQRDAGEEGGEGGRCGENQPPLERRRRARLVAAPRCFLRGLAPRRSSASAGAALPPRRRRPGDALCAGRTLRARDVARRLPLPVHSHGGACGAFRVLHGTCTLSLFNASGADGDSSSSSDDEERKTMATT